MELETVAQVQAPSKVVQPDESNDAAVVWNYFIAIVFAHSKEHLSHTELYMNLLMTDSSQRHLKSVSFPINTDKR